MAQVSHAPATEIDSSDSKPINTFSIEHILKSEPPSPSSSTDSGDELSDNSESNAPSNHVLMDPQVFWLLYQSQVQKYYQCLMINNLAANNKSSIPIKTAVYPDAYVSPMVKAKHKNLLKVHPQIRGTKRHDAITPSPEKRMKSDLYMTEQSQPEIPVLTREEYNLKCTKALPILQTCESVSNESALSPKTFLEMVDTNKVLNLSVTDLNVIIDNATFSDEERAYIRELRRKAMNKKAAEECRRRKKSEEQHLSEEFESLRDTRKRLCSEKERILLEIIAMKETVGELSPEPEETPQNPTSPTHTHTDTTLNPLI